MHHVLAVYGYRWLAPAVLVFGAVVFLVGIAAVHGDGGAEIRSTGALIILVSLVRISHLAGAQHARAAYSYGRHKRPRQAELHALPRREEAKHL